MSFCIMSFRYSFEYSKAIPIFQSIILLCHYNVDIEQLDKDDQFDFIDYHRL